MKAPDGKDIDIFEVADAWQCPEEYLWMSNILNNVLF